MRELSTNVANVIDSDFMRYFILVELHFNRNYYFTDLPYDITIDGKTYRSESALVEVEPPRRSSVVDREAYRIMVSDIGDELMAELAANVVGKVMEIKIGFMDSNGQPYTDPADIEHIYWGYVDKPIHSNDLASKIITFEATSPMADLDMVQTILVSKDGMDQFSTTDTSYDRMYENTEAELKWGKRG